MEEKKGSKLNRLFSRIIDYSIFALALHAVVSSIVSYLDPLVYLIGAVCIPVLYIPFEALQLYFWQTTFGKGVCGLCMKEEGRERFSLKGAFRAALAVFWKSGRFSVVSSMKKRRRVVSTLVTLLLSAGLLVNHFFFIDSMGFSATTLNQGWVKFISKEGKFSVDMPSKTEFQMKEFPIPPAGITLAMNEFTSKAEGEGSEVYSVSYVVLPRSWLLASSKKVLLGALYLKYETQLGSDVLSKKPVMHLNRLPAIDFVAKQNDRKIEGRLILSGNRLFQISKTTPIAAQPVAKEASAPGEKTLGENFVDSFNPLLR